MRDILLLQHLVQDYRLADWLTLGRCAFVRLVVRMNIVLRRIREMFEAETLVYLRRVLPDNLVSSLE